MATCKKEQTPKYVLTLDQDEVETLKTLLNSTGGDMRTTSRKFADDINAALGEDVTIRESSGAIYFSDDIRSQQTTRTRKRK